jgi:hypothetical protein
LGLCRTSLSFTCGALFAIVNSKRLFVGTAASQGIPGADLKKWPSIGFRIVFFHAAFKADVGETLSNKTLLIWGEQLRLTPELMPEKRSSR